MVAEINGWEIGEYHDRWDLFEHKLIPDTGCIGLQLAYGWLDISSPARIRKNEAPPIAWLR